MKKFLVVLLSLGLLVAFGATASAADVKFGGTYYVVGVYDNNQRLADTDSSTSRAFFYQRIRIQPVFQIAEGLTFTTRFDAMETQWGNTDWRGGFDAKYSSRRQNQSVGNPKIQESFEFERGYVGFATPIGLVQAGIMASGSWGTAFGDDTQSRPRARIDTKIGPWAMGFVYEKEFEADSSNVAGYAGKADADNDTYAAYGIFNWKGGNAGLLYKFFNRRAARVTGNNRAKFHALLPYVKANFGPVYFEAEVVYGFGKAAEFDSGVTPDVDIDNLGAYGKVQVNLGPAYFGGLALWSQGNDGSDPTKLKTGPASQDLEFGLILGNDALQTWESSAGAGGANGVTFDSGKQNVLMYGMYGGFKPTPKLKMELTLLSARRDKIAVTANLDKHLGIEFDATAEYKIYDNLSYMVGAGYLWTGDYFKGANQAGQIGNNYLLLNKLSLSF